MEKADIASMTLPRLTEWVTGELGEPKFRAGQLYRWLHQKRAGSFAEMTDLSAALRARLEQIAFLTAVTTRRRLESQLDGTVKLLLELPDRHCVEAVLMRYEHGLSLCISTQVGCRMGCKFCASTLGGLVRNLTPAEMLGEVYEAERQAGEPIASLVLMGIGEPLDNYRNVLDFLTILSSPEGRGLSLRHVSLSTCGLCDRIDELAELGLGLTLSISLHAADDETRSGIMPVNRKYNIARLMKSCKNYFAKTGRRISYEYALIAGVNDTPAHAEALASLLAGQNCHINLIPVNPVAERGTRRPDRSAVRRFADRLNALGQNATVRRELGSDIAAACGQLRRAEAESGCPAPNCQNKCAKEGSYPMLQINGATDRGMVREANEDRFAGEVFDRSSGYAVVCDGMGGAAGGGIAAGIAAEEVRRMVESSLRPHMEERSVHLLLESAVANANRAVYTRSEQAGGALCGMGTTLCAAVICDGTALVANIGDSRCYLLREDRLTQVTEDHTAVSAMIRLGLLTPEEAATHPDRHAITRAVGVEPTVNADYYTVDLASGDALLLCSDGLYNALPGEELTAALRQVLAGEDIHSLVTKANAAGGPDNITAVLIHNR